MYFRSKTCLFILTILCLLLPYTSIAEASTALTYYVSPTGSDLNPGTLAKPFLTIAKAAKTVSAGEVVIVEAGKYNQHIQLTISGASGAPITFQASGAVVMQGFTIDANYVVINGFEITTKALDSTGWGIYLTGSNDLIENNYVHDTTWGGILLFTTVAKPTLSSNDIVKNNRIYHVGMVGIDVRGRNNIVEDNDISYVVQYPAWLTNPPSWADADGIHFHGQGHILLGNSIHDISYSQPENKSAHIDCFQTFADASHEAAKNIVIENNICNNPYNATSTGSGTSGLTMQDATGSIVIRNNILNADLGAFVGGKGHGDNGIEFFNNDFVSSLTNNAAYEVGMFIDYDTNTVLKNNIFFDFPASQVLVSGGSGLIAGKNIFYNGGAPTADSSYHHTNDLWGVNPLLVSPQNGNYHLQAGSPAIDAGYNLGKLVPNDYAGTLRPKGKGYDIGAYEYVP